MYEAGKIGQGRTGVITQLLHLSLEIVTPQLRRSANYLKAIFFALYSWSVFALLVPVAWLLAVVMPSNRLSWNALGSCARLLAKATGTTINVKGLENLASHKDGCVIVANHASYLDSLVLIGVLRQPVRFVAKAELSGSPLTRLPLQSIRAEFVERFDALKSVDDTQNLHKVMRDGSTLLFFPEGTFTRIPGLRTFHMGAFLIAAEADVPVIPLAIRGTRSILRADSWFPHKGTINVTIGEAVEASTADEDGKKRWERALELRNRSRAFMLVHCGEPDLER
jgi:1-acyl-sn-glycerol-3-phosphate acyltransferase